MSQSLPPRKPKSSSVDEANPQERDERDHYSLDDMLDSLRDSEREKDELGEVVTRSDGSKARKVKRRKRRSDQPEASKRKSTKEAKAAKKKKQLVWRVSIGVTLLVLSLLGGLFLMIRYNSEAYTDEVESAVGEWSGASADFSGLRMLPGSISMNQAEFSWEDGYFTEKLSLKKISGHASVTSFLGGTMGGREVGGARGTLQLRVPESGVKWLESVPQDQFPYNFQRYFCDSLVVNFGEGGLFKVAGANASLRYLKGSGWKLPLGGGRFSMEGWAPFPIKVGLLEFEEGAVLISSLKLEPPEGMENNFYNPVLGVKGRIPLTLGSQATLELQTKNYPFEGLIGEKLGRIFTGTTRKINDSKLIFTVGNSEIDEIYMPFDGEEIRVDHLPFVRVLNELFPEHGFEKLVFNSAIDGVFRKLPQGLGIQNFRLSDENRLLKLEGNILLADDGTLKGAMRLFISLGLINSDPKLKTLPVFTNQNSNTGFSIVDFEIGGTADAPEDTFRQKIGLGGGGGISPANTGPSFDSLFEELTAPTPSSSDTSSDSPFKENTDSGN